MSETKQGVSDEIVKSNIGYIQKTNNIMDIFKKPVIDMCLDLLDARKERDEAREMIRVLRNGYDIIMGNTLNPAKTMTKLGLEESQVCNRNLATTMLERSKEFADE